MTDKDADDTGSVEAARCPDVVERRRPEDVAMVHRRVRVGDRHIAYREEAEPRDEPALVLVHGLGMSSRAFRPVLPHLADGFHVLAPDLPGCGDSDMPSQPQGVDDLVTDLVGWLDAVGLREAAFVGHSLGGQVVAYLADRAPQRVTRAVLVAATPDPEVAPAWRKAWWLLLDGVLEPPGLVAAATRDYVKAHPGRMWSTLKQALRSDVEARVARIAVPVLVVRGGRDRVVRERWSRRLTELIPDATFATIESGTHGLPSQSPVELAGLIRAFLQGSVAATVPADGARAPVQVGAEV